MTERKKGGISSTQGTGKIWCPFFIAHSHNEIQCEGPTDGCKCILRFRYDHEKDQHSRIFCQDRHRNCEIYRMLMEYKYGDDDR